SRRQRRSTSSVNTSPVGTLGGSAVSSLLRGTPATCAASSSASTRGEGTPASASISAASAISRGQGRIPDGLRLASIAPGHALGPVGRGERVEGLVEVAVHDVVEVVGGVADPVVGEPVLREVVGADALGPVGGAHLRAPGLSGGGGGLLLLLGEEAGAQDAQRGPLVLELALEKRGRAARPARPPERKRTRLNSSHVKNSYAVFCMKKKQI